jgi:hypothetical protein
LVRSRQRAGAHIAGDGRVDGGGTGADWANGRLKHCAAAAIQQGPVEAEAMYDELVEMMYRTSR